MITKSMMNFVSPIVTKNLETGGRGSMTKTTDYSGIGDALAKKAQMEMNMAQFKADMGMKMASMKADNELAILDIEDRRIDQELADRKAAQDMGDMEKVMGVLQGAASGAQAGMATGNPWVAAGAAVAGGAAVAHDAYGGKPGDEKRASVQNTNKTLGAVATIATATRGMYDDYKGKKAFEKGSKRMAEMREGIEAMAPGVEKDKAVQEYQKVKASVAGEIGGHLGIDAGNSAAEGFSKGESAHFSNDPEERYQADVASIGSALVADPAFNDPATRNQTKQKYYDQLQAATMRRNGYDSTKGSVSPEDYEAFENSYGGGGSKAGGGSYGGQAGSVGGVSGGGGAIPDPADGASIEQDPSYSPSTLSVPGFAGGTFNFPVGGGGGGYSGEYDDGTPVTSEQKLTEMGGPAAEAFRATQGENYDPKAAENAPTITNLEEMKAHIKKDNPGLSDKQLTLLAEDELRNPGGGGVGSIPNNAPGVVEKQVEAANELTGKDPNQGPADDGTKTANLVTQDAGNNSVVKQLQELQNNPPKVKEKEWTGSTGKLKNPEMEQVKKQVAVRQKEGQSLNQQIDSHLEKAKSHNLMSKDGLTQAQNIRTSQENLNKMEKLVGKVPNNSQIKSLAAKVYLEGLQTGKSAEALGTTIGMKGGIAGVIAGNVVGKTAGSILDGKEVLKGSETAVGKVLTKQEIDAITEYHVLSSVAVPPMVKTGDGNMVTNPEAEAMKNNFFNFGQTADRQAASLNVMRSDLATKAKSISEFSEAGQKQFNYQQATPIKMRTDADIGKAREVGRQRQLGTNDAKAAGQSKYRSNHFINLRPPGR